MKHNTACTGACMYENFKLEYQVVYLEFIHNKFLKIEAVCYNPSNPLDKEAILKYSTNNLNTPDERLKIAFMMIDSVIKNLNLSKSNLRKMVIKDHQVYYICKT
jgi:hypothetical protein